MWHPVTLTVTGLVPASAMAQRTPPQTHKDHTPLDSPMHKQATQVLFPSMQTFHAHKPKHTQGQCSGPNFV